MPPKKCITWSYIVQVLKGEKKFLKSVKIGLNRTFPRIKEIWPQFKNDKDLLLYFPDFVETRTPPRLYFVKIFSTLRSQKYQALIKDSKSKREEVAEEKNKVISVDQQVWNQLTNTKLHENLVTTLESKRILMSKKKGNK